MLTNKDRLISEFFSLVSIDSPSFKEAEMCKYLKKRLTELGIRYYEDDAALALESESGNLYAFLEGNLPGDPLLFCTHMDTVEPSHGKIAIASEDGIIKRKGNTVLGADDCSGIAAILEALNIINEHRLPHRPIELLFTVAEEAYCRGAEKFDFSKIKAKEGYVLDLTGPVGTAAYKAPTTTVFTAVIHGKSAHAGFAPEEGISAIRAASNAISKLTTGRIDEETTVNVGTISGGLATNIVPDECTVTGEIRSYSHQNAMAQLEISREIFETACLEMNAPLDFFIRSGCEAYETPLDHIVVKRFKNACLKQGLSGSLTSTFGGSDNNQLAKNGITGLVIASAMNCCHSCDEYTTVDELCRLSELALSLMCSEI